MMVYEVLTIAVICLLAMGAIVAIYIGLMNWAGGVFVVRCTACHHLTLSSTKDQQQESCPQCRHPVLTHPIYAARHPHQIRVFDDGLRY